MSIVKPDFHENQLEQDINFELRHLETLDGSKIHPYIPSRNEERLLGYDAGFYFHWMNFPYYAKSINYFGTKAVKVRLSSKCIN